MKINWLELFFHFLGGLGFFLFAMKWFGDGLQKATPPSLRDTLGKWTVNPIIATFIGIVLTGVVQSSTIATIVIVTFVSIHVITLRQSIGLIIGANIGSALTIVAMNSYVNSLAYLLLAIGVVCILMRKQRIQQWGQILFGFAGLFIGIDLIQSSMMPLHNWHTWTDLIMDIEDSPMIGIITGSLLSVITQTEAPTIDVLQQLYTEELISLQGAIPIVFGENIGATILVLFAALFTTVLGKRVAAAHMLFNLFGTILLMIFLIPFTLFVQWIASTLFSDFDIHIAIAHSAFNVVNALIYLCLIRILIVIVTKLFPGEDYTIEYKPRYLNTTLSPTSPADSLSQVKQEVVRMGEYGVQSLDEALNYLITADQKHADIVAQLEETINHLDKETTTFLVSLSKHSLSERDSRVHHSLLNTIRDIERIGDRAENLVELIDYKKHMNVQLSSIATREIKEMFDLTITTVSLAIRALDQRNIEFAKDVAVREEQIDTMEETLRNYHIKRLDSGICESSAGLVYADIITNLERIGDHAYNIAKRIIALETKD